MLNQTRFLFWCLNKVMTIQEKSPDTDDAPLPQTAGARAEEAGAVLDVDLTALRANYDILCRRALPVDTAAVVKADGYGLGLEPIVQALLKAGCKVFFVADLGEARRARAVAPDADIYVLGGPPPGTGPTFAELRVRPVLSSLIMLAEWDRFVADSGWNGGAALQIDTGINRLGLTIDEAVALTPRIQLQKHGITLVMSHFACAETANHPANDKQIRAFRDLRVLFRGITASLANSSGIFLGDGALCDLVRPGAALYGVNPTPASHNPMRPVVTLRAPVLQVRDLARGDQVGYGAIWTAAKPARIAVIGVGYADGYHRSGSSADGKTGGHVLIDGTRCPLAGRISMDLMAIDVTGLPERTVQRGTYVTLIGDKLTVDDVAKTWGTIGYEVLTSLGRRYHRRYYES